MRNDHYSNRFKLNFLAFGLDVNLVLCPVADAAYSRRGPVSKCHPGTREDAVAELMRLFDKEGGHSICQCWLNGPAGSGKSATLVERLVHQGRLIDTFFFIRGEGDRSIVARLNSYTFAPALPFFPSPCH